MIDPAHFRSGQHGIPFACREELPPCCFICPYLVYEEFSVCFIQDPFYYYCAYSWPDKLTEVTPPCLSQKGD